MHGLIIASFEGFIRANYGAGSWGEIIGAVDPGFDVFEPMLEYDDQVVQATVDAAAAFLGKPRDTLLEDFGTALVAGEEFSRVRRLLRFGGSDYADFLHSLEDLPGRARLAVPDLVFAPLELDENGPGEFSLTCRDGPDGFGLVMLGVLRAMGDDYGALVFVEHLGREGGDERLSIHLLDAAFAEGRDFSLAAGGV